MQTLQEIMQELREFRASQPPHDLSMLRHRYPDKRNPPEPVAEPVQEAKKPKRKKMLE